MTLWKPKNNIWLMLTMNKMKFAVIPNFLLVSYCHYVLPHKFKKIWLKYKFMTSAFGLKTLELTNKDLNSHRNIIPGSDVNISSYLWLYPTTLKNSMFMYLRAESDPDSEFFFQFSNGTTCHMELWLKKYQKLN